MKHISFLIIFMLISFTSVSQVQLSPTGVNNNVNSNKKSSEGFKKKFNNYIVDKKDQINSKLGVCSKRKGTLNKASCLQLEKSFPHRMVCQIGMRFYTDRFKRELVTRFMIWQFDISSFDRFTALFELEVHRQTRDGRVHSEQVSVPAYSSDSDVINNLLSDGSFTVVLSQLKKPQRNVFNLAPKKQMISKFKFNSVYNTFEFEQTLGGMFYHNGVCRKRL